MRCKILFLTSIILLICLSIHNPDGIAEPQIEPTKWDMASISALARGYMTSRIFLTAMELGVFAQLGTQQLTASQMAQQLNTDERATEILLNALTGISLLKKKANLFANVEEVADLLIPGSPHYQGGGFGHTAHLWDAWSHLTEIVRSGHPFKRLLSSIIHAFGEEENISLLKKVEESLKDAGRVVIRDFIIDESKTKPASAAIFAVNMLVNTQNGCCYSFSEVKGWLQSLGFKDIHQVPMDRSQLIIGKKGE